MNFKNLIIFDLLVVVSGFILGYLFGFNWIVLSTFLPIVMFLSICLIRKLFFYKPIHIAEAFAVKNSRYVRISELKKSDIGRKVLWTHFGGEEIGTLSDWTNDKIKIKLDSGSAWIAPVTVEWADD